MNTAVVSVGSNINPQQNIDTAKEFISGKFKLISISSFVVTEPIGFKEQQDFLNGAFLIQTGLDLEGLNDELKKIEIDMGRVKTSNKEGPRIIDLDIIIWNNKIIDDDVYKRTFLQKSVIELLPDFKF